MERGGLNSSQKVETQIRNTAQRLFRIAWDRDGDQLADGGVAATSEHPFWTFENGWTRADTLRPGMHLRTRDGTKAAILQSLEQQGQTSTYNLDVDGPDTFLVATQSGDGVLVHNLDGDVYPWRNPHREVGMSPVINFFTGNPEIDPVSGLQKIGRNPAHHFHYDAWLQANYTNFDIVDRRVVYPCIELTYEQHYFAHKASEEWLMLNYGKRSGNMGNRWQNVKVSEMDDLSRVMIAAANAHGANLTELKLNTLKNLCCASLKTFHKKFCDP
jgi:hypothetical protein